MTFFLRGLLSLPSTGYKASFRVWVEAGKGRDGNGLGIFIGVISLYLGDPVLAQKSREVVRFHNLLDGHEVLWAVEESLRSAPEHRIRHLEPPSIRVDYSPAGSLQLRYLALQDQPLILVLFTCKLLASRDIARTRRTTHDTCLASCAALLSSSSASLPLHHPPRPSPRAPPTSSRRP